MAPLSAVLAVALLALGGVDAKRKDKVSYSRYMGADCQGHPLSGEMYDLKLESTRKSQCQPLNGYGIRFHKQKKDKYSKWINDVNLGMDECGATLYRDFGCVPNKAVGNVSLPKDFTKCNTLPQAAGSVKFWCEPNQRFYGVAVPREVQLAVTSYSIADDGKAYPSVYTTTLNATRRVYQPVDYATDEHTTVAAPKLDARVEPTHKAALEPRRTKHNVKGVWMTHPWTGSDLCFKCWTKKETDFGKFYCRSGHGDKYAIDCGPKPAAVPLTSTHRITHTQSIEIWSTTTDLFTYTPTPTGVAEKRSPHTAVVLHNPWLPDRRVCADAEWENSGKSKAEVRIQKIKAFKKCDNKNALNIDIGIPEYTHNLVTTTTASITLTTRPTWATDVTVTRAPPQ